MSSNILLYLDADENSMAHVQPAKLNSARLMRHRDISEEDKGSGGREEMEKNKLLR